WSTADAEAGRVATMIGAGANRGDLVELCPREEAVKVAGGIQITVGRLNQSWQRAATGSIEAHRRDECERAITVDTEHIPTKLGGAGPVSHRAVQRPVRGLHEAGLCVHGVVAE